MQVKSPILKSKIVEAARICFFKYGYKNTFLDRIAKEAFTTVGNLYNYFNGKNEIFDEVIGDIPLQLDAYISTYYYKAVKNIDNICLNMDLKLLFPEVLIFNPKVSMTLWILLEGAEGTQYAQYKEGLYSIIEDCTQNSNPNINPMLVKILRETFINKILSITRGGDEKNSEIMIDEGQLYSFQLDVELKIFHIDIINWMPSNEKRLENFLTKYKELVKKINAHEYELVIDCRAMPNMAGTKELKILAEYYNDSHFLKVKYLFNSAQIALAVVFKRIFFDIRVSNFEVCIV